MELYVTTESDASEDIPSHHTGEIPICRYDDGRDERQVFFNGNIKMNLCFIHIIFVKAHSVDWGS
jgi:hypothetical protein